MSKELTPLEALKTIILGTNVDTYRSSVEEIDNAISIIETALKRLEKIETTTHSVLREDISNKLKALEIIKEKRVDVDYLITCIERNIKPLQNYNEYIKEFYGIELAQEEYDLLKEVLLWLVFLL